MSPTDFYGPSKGRPTVHVVRKAFDGKVVASFDIDVEEIDRLHEHVHLNDEKPKPVIDTSLPPWCPTRDKLIEAQKWIRRIAQEADDRMDCDTPFESDVLGWAERAMDALGGGPVLKDPLEIDDEEDPTERDREHEWKRPLGGD